MRIIYGVTQMKTDMLTVQQTAEKWNMSVRGVQNLCKLGKITGAVRFGASWMIPADAQRPADKRRKEVKENEAEHRPLIRKSPFLDMTDLYNTPGTADECVEALAYHPEAQALFAAEIAYSRGEIDKVYDYANYFLERRSGFYAVVSGGMLLALCAMWKGDLQMWQKAKAHLYEAPCENEIDRDIVMLSLAATDSAIRETKDFPEWFKHGCFDNLPADAHPAARVYYIKHLLISAQELALNKIKLDGVSGLGLMKTLPYIMEPMITQMVTDKIVIAEIYLRLLCGLAYHQSGDDTRAALHIDKAIALALPDRLYGPLVEHRRQLGLFLDERLALADADALKRVKELHKQLHTGWIKLHNAVLENNVSESLTVREREIARLAAFGLSNAEIAKQLSLSAHTVNALIIQAKNKTGAKNRMDLGAYI